MQLTYIVLIKRTPKNPEKVYSILFKWHKNDEPFSDVLSVHPWGQWAEKKTSPKQQQQPPPRAHLRTMPKCFCAPLNTVIYWSIERKWEDQTPTFLFLAFYRGSLWLKASYCIQISVMRMCEILALLHKVDQAQNAQNGNCQTQLARSPNLQKPPDIYSRHNLEKRCLQFV